jgi:hypothetical protein
MKRTYLISQFTLLLAGIVLLGLSQSARAGGTDSGTEIKSIATLDYSVSGTNMADISTTENESMFVVDRKVDLTIAANDSSAVTVTPGKTAALSFTVKNTGNNQIGIALTAIVRATDASGRFGTNDGFDMNDVKVCTDAAGTTEVGAVETFTKDQQRTIYIVATSPAAAAGIADGAIASYHLQAQATQDETGTALDNTVADTKLEVQTVFADGYDADYGLDTNYDGIYTNQSDFESSNTVLTVSKERACIWNPVTHNTAPKAIPGAYVQYTITISNAAGAAPASLTTIKDILAGEVAIDPDLKEAADADSLSPESAVAKSVKVVARTATSYYTSASDSDAVTLSGTELAIDLATLLPEVESTYTAGELKAGESVVITYNVIIQ